VLRTKDPKPVKLPRDWAKNGTVRTNEARNLPDRQFLDYHDPGSNIY
jgi:hypothetical protein